ncbi:MAG: SDR family oxidoreductase [Geminicoccaceae bacterium]|nr:SDR family oxidoreductase [Geminicoccaceae bacterium]MCX8102150.1 SDR family oxidoreductase [Geminicoccaceae bacterium]MDW8368981.1 SDR family oxidoreductase [Geminicoccaceae bacterium]
MRRLEGKVAWITGAGSGIGAATARALAEEGAAVVLTGRRPGPLAEVASTIGRAASIEPCDVTDPAAVRAVVERIRDRHGRLDILVANAGINVVEREWARLRPEDAAAMIAGNLTSAFHCALAVLPIMRAQRDGLLVHTASIAGRLVKLLSGPAYTAAKHGLVAASHTINIEEGVHGIRSTVVLPGEVATPLLDRRPVPVPEHERARMLRPEDVADLIRYVACLPPRVTLPEIWITPTWNRLHLAELDAAGITRPAAPPWS